jgi:hypothetical protein
MVPFGGLSIALAWSTLAPDTLELAFELLPPLPPLLPLLLLLLLPQAATSNAQTARTASPSLVLMKGFSSPDSNADALQWGTLYPGMPICATQLR